MKTYKTWEMIKELTENPEKKFRNKNIPCAIVLNSINMLVDEDRNYINIPIDADWEEVKEPVSFMEAVKSGKKIRSVTWMQNTELDLPNLLYDMSDFDEEEIRQLLLDKWYIED